MNDKKLYIITTVVISIVIIAILAFLTSAYMQELEKQKAWGEYFMPKDSAMLPLRIRLLNDTVTKSCFAVGNLTVQNLNKTTYNIETKVIYDYYNDYKSDDYFFVCPFKTNDSIKVTFEADSGTHVYFVTVPKPDYYMGNCQATWILYIDIGYDLKDNTYWSTS